MTFSEAAAHVLRLVGKPLHYKEITDVAIERGLLSHVGKSPEVTMGARLAAQVKKAASDNPLSRVKPGVFALADWDEAKIKKGLADRTPAIDLMKAAEAVQSSSPARVLDGDESDGEPDAVVEAARPKPVAVHREIVEVDDAPPDEEERRRAELSATATELFESEDDDDQPIFGGPAEESRTSPSRGDADADGERSDGKRRRRRRRGRGRKDEESGGDGGDDLPTYTVSDADPDVLPEIGREEESQDEISPQFEVGDDGGAASLADALEGSLAKYDRGRGPVSAQNVADSLRRGMRGEAALNAAAVVAIAYADNLAAERSSRAPRFRVSGNKIALTAWSSDRRALERKKLLERAAEQYRESTLRALSDELKRLPQRAVGELIVVLLDRMGVQEITSVRRPGAHGSELHLSGIVASGGLDIRSGGAIRLPTAIMIRRDGKDIGRERVTELRGALHHYGPASHAWVISTGQVLSGAREEALSVGGSPVTLSGRNELAELCLAYGVGVRMHRLEIPSVDVELFENLQGR